MTAGSVSPSREDKTRAGRWRLWGTLLIAVLSPLSLALVNDDWLFTPVGYLDPFQYVGLFMNFDRPDFLAGHYKLARLPWVISGYLAYQALPPMSASIVLHLVYLAVAVGSTFLAVWIAFRDLAIASLASVALGFFTPFHGSGGWDYHNTAAGTYYLMTIALVHGAIWFPRRRRACLLSAGATLALTLHSNITFVNLVPFLLAYSWGLVRVREGSALTRRALGWSLIWLAAGSAVSTAVLCVVSVLAGREPLFFWPLVEIVVRYVADTRHLIPWWKPWRTLWFLHASYLAIPTVVCAASIAGLAIRSAPRCENDRSERECRQIGAVLMLGQFLGICALWLFWQTLGQVALMPDYFAYPIYPVCYLAIAGFLYRHGQPLRDAHAAGVGLLVVAAFWMFLVLQTGTKLKALWPEAFAYPVVPGIVLAIGAFVAFLGFRGGRAAFAVFGLLLAAANSSVLAGTNTVIWPVAQQVATGYGWNDPCRVHRDLFDVVVSASKLIWKVDPGFDRAHVWFPENASFRLGWECTAKVGDLGYSITEAATGGRFLAPPWPMPGVDELPDVVLQEASQEDYLIILITRNVGDVERMRQRFLRLGLDLELVRQAHVSSGSVGVDLYALLASGKQKVPSRWSRQVTLQNLSGQALRDSWQVNIYGLFHRGGLAGAPGGATFFESRTRRDHVALPFVELPWGHETPPTTERRWALVEAFSGDVQNREGGCRIVLQTESFVRLGGTACPSGTDTNNQAFIMLPAGTKRVRLYIENQPGRFRSELPQSLRLSVMMEPRSGDERP